MAKNKQKSDLAEAKDTFIPSTGDEPYLDPAGSKQPIAERKDWTQGLGALSLGELGAMANTINETVEKTETAVARGQIKVGKELLRARGIFRGDKEFGKWRESQTYIKSKTAATQLMRVAEKFDKAPALVEACSFSVLRELVYAPEEAVDSIKKKAEAGEKVTKADAIEAKRAATGTSKKATTAFIDKPDTSTIEERVMATIAKPIAERIKVSANPWDILGLYRFAPVHVSTVNAIEDYWTKDGQAPDDVARKVVEAAHKVRRELVA